MTSARDLTGKIALVTGGDHSIGRAVVRALAEVGADIVLNHRSRESEADQVRSLVENYGRRCITVRADVSVAAGVIPNGQVHRRKAWSDGHIGQQRGHWLSKRITIAPWATQFFRSSHSWRLQTQNLPHPLTS